MIEKILVSLNMVESKSCPISVVIPLFNKRDTILRAVRSVLRQLRPGDELIVINDGSTDGSEQLIQGIIDSRMRLINQRNAGVGAARNRGWMLARNKFVGFLDADDLWLPGTLDEFRHMIQLEAGTCLYSVGTRRLSFGAIGSEFDRRQHSNGEIRVYSGPAFLRQFGKQELITSSSACVEKDALLAIGGFPENVETGEDLYVWMRIALTSGVTCSSRVGGLIQGRLPSPSSRRTGLPFHFLWFADSKNLNSLRTSEREAVRHFLSTRLAQVCFGLVVEGRPDDANALLQIHPDLFASRRLLASVILLLPQSLASTIFMFGRFVAEMYSWFPSSCSHFLKETRRSGVYPSS